MKKSNICSNKKVDYFISTQENPDASEGNIQSYLLFKKDGNVIAICHNIPFSGTWNSNTVTLRCMSEEMTLPFTIEDDLLTLSLDENFAEVELFTRSNEAIPFQDIQNNSDMTVEVEVTNGIANGIMSAYCPKGWYCNQSPDVKGSIRFSLSPDPRSNLINITITCSAIEDAKFTLNGEELIRALGDREWHLIIDEENNIIELITVIGNSAITVKGFPAEELIEQILPSIQLSGNIQESNCCCANTDNQGIIMTIETEGEVKISLGGEGTACIDWGDGSPVETVTIPMFSGKYEHHYAQQSEYTVKITGEYITEFEGCDIGITNLILNISTLEYLKCESNKLTSLDLSKATELTSVYCESNKLTSLDVSKNTELKNLYCEYNQLTNLDVSKNIELTYLPCGNNKLTSLDLTANTALENLECCNNLLTSLDLSHNKELTDLYCRNNQLTSLDLSVNTELRNLDCPFNQLTSLDLSANVELRSLNCMNNQFSAEALNAIFHSVRSNDDIKHLIIFDNPGANTCNRSIAEQKGWMVS